MTAATKSWTFESITPATVAAVRATVSEIAKRHKIARKDARVFKGTGSMRHAVMIAVECSPAVRIEICEALIVAGFESVHAPYGPDFTIEGHHIKLARVWEHTDVRVSVARCVSRPS